MSSIEERLAGLEARVTALEDERGVIANMYRYAHSIDYGLETEWVDCFTEDGAFDMRRRPHFAAGEGQRYEGREALAAFIATHTRAPETWHKHLMAQPRIAVEGDEAKVESFFLRLDEDASGRAIRARIRALPRPCAALCGRTLALRGAHRRDRGDPAAPSGLAGTGEAHTAAAAAIPGVLEPDDDEEQRHEEEAAEVTAGGEHNRDEPDDRDGDACDCAAREGEGGEPEREHGDAREREERPGDADRGRRAPPPVERKPRREDVPNDGQRARCERHPLVAGEREGEGDSGCTLGEVEEDGREGGDHTSAVESEEVAGAHIAVASPAQVDAIAASGDEPGEGHGAGDDREQEHEDVDQHATTAGIVRLRADVPRHWGVNGHLNPSC